jgi:AAA+ ATPase superfamily predicted ATPase
MFFGREDDFQFVSRKIGEGRSNQIAVLCGERRSGKTSILFQILGGRLGPGFLPVLIDMQMLAGIKGDLEFFRAVLRAGCASLEGAALDLDVLEARAGATVEGLFEEFLRAAQAAAPGRIVLFLLDEYELIESKVRDGSLSEAAVHYLAGILEGSHRVSFVFTGSTNLEDRKADIWRSLLAKSIYRKISYLSENDTRRLITEPLKEWIRWPEQETRSIARLTGGQPFYTQVICQNMVDLLIEQGRCDPGPDDLERIVRDIVDNPLPQMIYSWNSLGEWEQVILASLASRLEGPDEWAGAAQVAAFIRGNRIVLPFARERIHVLLEEGYHAEFLEKSEEGSYRFRMDLFRAWIRREHSIWKVAKEARLGFRRAAKPAVIAVSIAVPLLALAAAAWFLLVPLLRARAGAPAGEGHATQGMAQAGTGTQPAEQLVEGIIFAADRGPFRASIDGQLTVTSEGRADPKTIAAPPLKAGRHSIVVKALTGEESRLAIEARTPGERFAVVFPAPRSSPQAPAAESAVALPPAEEPASVAAPQTESQAPARGVLILNTQPPGARIILDGQPVPQQTPFAQDVEPGEHRVRLALEGHATVDFPVLVEAGSQAKMDLVLVEAWAELTFDVQPTARISLDGAWILDTPYARPYRVRSGRHTLLVENEALGVKKSIEVELVEGERRLIQEVLK